MQHIFLSIWLDLTIILIGFVSFIVFTIYFIQRKGGYKTHIVELPSLKQKVIIAQSKYFQQTPNKQDKIFKKHFYIGKELTIEGEMLRISRVNKIAQLQENKIVYKYIVYFKKYENIECQNTINIQRHPIISKVVIDNQIIQIIKHDQSIENLSLYNIEYNHTNNSICLMQKTMNQESDRYKLTKDCFDHLADYQYIEAILDKYAKLNESVDLEPKKKGWADLDDNGGIYFMRNWSAWIRWLCVLPGFIIGYVIGFFSASMFFNIIENLTHMQNGPNRILLKASLGAMLIWGLAVSIASSVVPSHRYLTSIILSSLVVILQLIIFFHFYDSTEMTFDEKSGMIVGMISSLCGMLIVINKNKNYENKSSR